jgi:hypothetical protein
MKTEDTNSYWLIDSTNDLHAVCPSCFSDQVKVYGVNAYKYRLYECMEYRCECGDVGPYSDLLPMNRVASCGCCHSRGG